MIEIKLKKKIPIPQTKFRNLSSIYIMQQFGLYIYSNTKTNNFTLKRKVCVCVTLKPKCYMYLLTDVAKRFGHLAYTYLTDEPQVLGCPHLYQKSMPNFVHIWIYLEVQHPMDQTIHRLCLYEKKISLHFHCVALEKKVICVNPFSSFLELSFSQYR